MRNEFLAEQYEWIAFLKKWRQELPNNRAVSGFVKEELKRIRRRIKNLNDNMVDPLEKSLADEWRHRCREDGEGGVDYALIQDNGETDEEIEDFVRYEVGYPEIYSQWDCTGRPFTVSIDWHRNNGTISLIHRWALDV